MAHEATPEQLAILDATKNTDDNLIIQALAGAAKTSTLILIADALPDTQMLCLAFNKKVAVEMTERMPKNVQAMTLNSLGHRTWSEACGRRLIINSSKTYEILSKLVGDLSPTERRSLDDSFADIMRVIDFGTQCGYIPTGKWEKGKRLMGDEDFFPHLEQRLDDLQIDLIRKATCERIDQAWKGNCDYNDQIFMPTLFTGVFPRFPLVLVDEAQDLSALNHATLRKLVKKRIIAVGDSRQAIYGFRGAHEDSMNKLAQEFNMRELGLSISFRCPQAVVRHARWRAPHMQYPEWAKPGAVTHLEKWSADDIPERAAVICRNNAPLFSMAIKFLKNGRHSEIKNADIAKNLLKVMRKFGNQNMSQSEVIECIEAWESKEKTKSKKRAFLGIEDRAECMRIFAYQGESLREAIAYAEHLCNSTGPLKLMTGHGSKGLEFDHVFFLDQELVGPDDQDPNLRYVIQTRAKETLTYVNSGDFVGV